MGTHVHHSVIRTAVSVIFQILVLTGGLACFNASPLQAQPPYSTAAGKTTTFAFYDPLQAPVPKAPSTPVIPFIQSPLPVIPLNEYQAIKSAGAAEGRASFSSPRELVTSGLVVPRAPGTVPRLSWRPLRSSFQGIVQPTPQSQPPSPDIAVGPSDVLMVVNSSLAQFSRTGTLKKLTQFQDFFSVLLPTIVLPPPARFSIRRSATTSFTAGLFSWQLPAPATCASPICCSRSPTAPPLTAGGRRGPLNASSTAPRSTANWADFWRVGFDNVAIYLSGNMYNSVSTFQYAKIRVLLKSDVYKTSAARPCPTRISSTSRTKDGSVQTRLPPCTAGQTSGRQLPTVDQCHRYRRARHVPHRLEDRRPASQSHSGHALTVTGAISVYLSGTRAPARHWPATLDSGDARILKAVYRNGFLYTARDTKYPTPQCGHQCHV